jgi:flagellar biogenesis protein FliO
MEQEKNGNTAMASDKNGEHEESHREKQFNFFGALGLLVFNAFYLVSAINIKDPATAKWYESAALFPKVIGALLFVFCLVYLVKNIHGAIIKSEDKRSILRYLKSKVFLRLIVAIGLLAFYIFILLRINFGSFKLPYEVSTFIYLTLNMMFFRTPKYAFWKILIISALVSFGVGFCFRYGAKLPLP